MVDRVPRLDPGLLRCIVERETYREYVETGLRLGLYPPGMILNDPKPGPDPTDNLLQNLSIRQAVDSLLAANLKPGAAYRALSNALAEFRTPELRNGFHMAPSTIRKRYEKVKLS